MRKIVSALFVVFAILASAVPANAQRIGYIPQSPEGWYYAIQGDQVAMLTADNLGMVRGLSNQLRRSQFRSLRDDLRWNGSAYGLYGQRGFYPMYDRDRKPMSAKKAAIIYGAIGAAGGALVGRYVGAGTTKNQVTSTIVGAGFGALVGALTHRGNGNNQRNQRDNGPLEPQQNVRYASDGTPIAVGTRPNGYQSVPVEPSQPVWKVFRNRFEGLEVRVHVVGDNPSKFITVSAGEEVSLELPANAKIWAEVMVWKGSRQVPTQELGQRELPYHSGWVFFNPAKGEL